MRTGLVFYRLIGLLLAITTFYPSWISGPCCCTQAVFAKKSAATCCLRAGRSLAATSTTQKKSCCAARGVTGNTDLGRPNSVRPVSNCCCRLHLNSASLSGLVRSVELTAVADVPVAEVWQAIRPVALQSDPTWNLTGSPDEPLYPSERCALLCRWLA